MRLQFFGHLERRLRIFVPLFFYPKPVPKQSSVPNTSVLRRLFSTYLQFILRDGPEKESSKVLRITFDTVYDSLDHFSSTL